MAQQTALQSFWNKIALKLSVEQVNEFLPEFEQAKRMDKEQIMYAYCKGVNDHDKHEEGHKIDWEQYYNETFNKE